MVLLQRICYYKLPKYFREEIKQINCILFDALIQCGYYSSTVRSEMI